MLLLWLTRLTVSTLLLVCFSGSAETSFTAIHLSSLAVLLRLAWLATLAMALVASRLTTVPAWLAAVDLAG